MRDGVEKSLSLSPDAVCENSCLRDKLMRAKYEFFTRSLFIPECAHTFIHIPRARLAICRLDSAGKDVDYYTKIDIN